MVCESGGGAGVFGACSFFPSLSSCFLSLLRMVFLQTRRVVDAKWLVPIEMALDCLKLDGANGLDRGGGPPLPEAP